MRKLQETNQSFEDIYPHYPFAPLVHLAVSFAEWLARQQKRQEDGSPESELPLETAAEPAGRDFAIAARRRQDDLAA